MLITYLRSSSYGGYSWCEQKYLIESVLGYKDSPNQKTELGTIVHKALELMARKKQAIQNGQSEFTEAEVGKTYNTEALTKEEAIEDAWNHYTGKRDIFDWSGSVKINDKKTLSWKDAVRDSVNIVENFPNGKGMYWPMNMQVLQPEQFFTMELEEDWAKYDFHNPWGGERIQGKLFIKGTIDLVTGEEDGIIEYVDWKNGKRKDWAKGLSGKEKDQKKLYKDPQLLLYFLALNKLYPNAKSIFITIYFIQDGGPFTLCFTKEYIDVAKFYLKKRFEEIKANRIPRLAGNGQDFFKCKKLCDFYKKDFEGNILDDKNRSQSVCQQIKQQVLQLGIDKVTAKHGNLKAVTNYSSGGGVENREP